jgi:hypothetical protein
MRKKKFEAMPHMPLVSFPPTVRSTSAGKKTTGVFMDRVRLQMLTWVPDFLANTALFYRLCTHCSMVKIWPMSLTMLLVPLPV